MSGSSTDSGLFLFPEAKRYHPAVEEWLHGEPEHLYSKARFWFNQLRQLGEDVCELIHDGSPVACVGQAAFAYVNVYKRHINVGFFTGAFLTDPEGLLIGNGKRMRHVKIVADDSVNEKSLRKLIMSAYTDVKTCLT